MNLMEEMINDGRLTIKSKTAKQGSVICEYDTKNNCIGVYISGGDSGKTGKALECRFNHSEPLEVTNY